MKDHSQWGEQEHILKFFGDKKGRFLDIGAFDGVTGSNTRALAELGWEGVYIEANPFVFAELLRNCKEFPFVRCVSAAVMPEDGLVEFRDAIGQCGSCLANPEAEYLVQRKYHVAAISPAEIGLVFGLKYDFVSLDIEGMDLEVLYRMGGLLADTSLLCFEDAIPCRPFDLTYYEKLLARAEELGFSRIIARTGPTLGSANTLIARAP